MIKLINKITAAFFLALLLASCVRNGDVNVIGVEDVNFDNITKPELVFMVVNSSGQNIRLRDGKFSLMMHQTEILEVMLAHDITIPRKSEGSIAVPLRVKLSNPFVLLGLSNTDNINVDDFTITGEIIIKAGISRKKFRFNDMPVSDFLTTFGIDRKKLEDFRL